MNAARIPNVLSIAGSDPSGGAGLQADLKTFAAFDVNGGAVITALTAQNTRRVARVMAIEPSFVAIQLATVLDDVSFGAVKVGMLGTAGIAESIAGLLAAYGVQNIVVDPVMRASTGSPLIDADAVGVLRAKLLPLARIVTPNAAEAGVLLGRPAPASLAEMRDAACGLRSLGPSCALVTGGHVDTGAECIDVLCDEDGATHDIRSPRISGPDRHGTGCTLSAAIAALLALGRDVRTACEEAQAYVGAAIAAGANLDAGRGAGPLHHIPFSAALPARLA